MKRWLTRIAVTGWFVLALLADRVDTEASVLHSGQHPSPLLALLMALPFALLTTGVVVGAIRITIRYPITRHGTTASLVRHLLFVGGMSVAFVFARMLMRTLFAQHAKGMAAPSDWDSIAGLLAMYALWAALTQALELAKYYQQKHAAALRLQGELSRVGLERASAELRMLKMQLNPHFLFNSLNAVTLLIVTAPATAQRMVVRLAELLRRAMHSVATQEVALDEELAGLVPFVEIEQLRLGGQLHVEWAIADKARDALVPHMLLQPLVENAIKHGIVPAGGRGTLWIEARRDGDWLALTVRDDGVGVSTPSQSETNGVGSANVRARLAELYGTRHRMELRPAAGRGTVAIVHLPWHEEPLGIPTMPREQNRDTLDAASLTPPPASRGLLSIELALTIALVAERWLHGYPARYEEAVAHGVAAARQLAIVFSGTHAIVLYGGLLAIVRLTRARPLLRNEWRTALPTHAVLAAAFFLALFSERLVKNIAIGYTSRDRMPGGLAAYLAAFIMTYVLFASVAHAAEYVRRYRWRHAAELQLYAELSRAELERTSAELRMLKMQLNPHFLFNSLNALSLLITTTPATAQRIVVALAALLRRAMHSVATQEVTLEEELAGLAPFIEIERLRLGDGLRVEWAIAQEAREALVPHILLLPLVENAIKHGFVHERGLGVIRIEAARADDWLVLTVTDNGVGLGGDQALATGGSDTASIGVANVRARLVQLYGSRHLFELRAADGGGTIVQLRLPWHGDVIEHASLAS